MKWILIALLILTTLQQEQILATSGDSSSQVGSSSQGDSSAIPFTPTKSSAPTDWGFLRQSSLGDNSKWITPDSTQKIWPKWWMVNYYVTFYTDCPNPVTLVFAATGYFQVYLNETLIKDWQSPWPSVTKFQFKPLCGCNRLRILVFNWWQSPAAVIFNLYQNTAGCYDCERLGITYYNRDKCRCECVAPCKCYNSLMQWSDYPRCGCQCSPQKNDKYCPSNKFWNYSTCSCQCRKVCCKKGYVQDPQSCNCKATWVPSNGVITLDP